MAIAFPRRGNSFDRRSFAGDASSERHSRRWKWIFARFAKMNFGGKSALLPIERRV
jgi:hypothetical protein